MSEGYGYTTTGPSRRALFKDLQLGDGFYTLDLDECSKIGRSHARSIHGGKVVFVAPQTEVIPLQSVALTPVPINPTFEIKSDGSTVTMQKPSHLYHTVVKLNIETGRFEIQRDDLCAIPTTGSCWLLVQEVRRP